MAAEQSNLIPTTGNASRAYGKVSRKTQAELIKFAETCEMSVDTLDNFIAIQSLKPKSIQARHYAAPLIHLFCSIITGKFHLFVLGILFESGNFVNQLSSIDQAMLATLFAKLNVGVVCRGHGSYSEGHHKNDPSCEDGSFWSVPDYHVRSFNCKLLVDGGDVCTACLSSGKVSPIMDLPNAKNVKKRQRESSENISTSYSEEQSIPAGARPISLTLLTVPEFIVRLIEIVRTAGLAAFRYQDSENKFWVEIYGKSHRKHYPESEDCGMCLSRIIVCENGLYWFECLGYVYGQKHSLLNWTGQLNVGNVHKFVIEVLKNCWNDQTLSICPGRRSNCKSIPALKNIEFITNPDNAIRSFRCLLYGVNIGQPCSNCNDISNGAINLITSQTRIRFLVDHHHSLGDYLSA